MLAIKTLESPSQDIRKSIIYSYLARLGNCIDINECNTGNHNCDVNAKCINISPTYVQTSDGASGGSGIFLSRFCLLNILVKKLLFIWSKEFS